MNSKTFKVVNVIDSRDLCQYFMHGQISNWISVVLLLARFHLVDLAGALFFFSILSAMGGRLFCLNFTLCTYVDVYVCSGIAYDISARFALMKAKPRVFVYYVHVIQTNIEEPSQRPKFRENCREHAHAYRPNTIGPHNHASDIIHIYVHAGMSIKDRSNKMLIW